MPKDLEPMSPTLIPEPFNHADWQFEIKWDGFRMLAYCEDKIVNLRSKNNHSFNRRFPAVKTELERLGITAVLDGELVVLNERGVADFNKIMSAINVGTLAYYVFDILWYDGNNLMNTSLVNRRKILKSILPTSNIVRFSDHIDLRGCRNVFEATYNCCE
jgi:bifunctional non-homologous end joining protein LigD